jgi:hypothetical protein|tara:strand:- start:509 stop:742 length:234 start_codon:yes stop_codon:yes gene_type:complete
METLKVKGHSELVRDIETGAIINTNVKAAELARRRTNIISKQNVKIDTVGIEIDTLKNEMGEIKSMLRELIQDKNDG